MTATGAVSRRTLSLLPGVAAAMAVALLAQWLSGIAGALVLRAQGVDPVGRGSPISAVAVAVLVGVALSSFAARPALAPGLDFAVKKVLRLGIVLVGVKLALMDVLRVGATAAPAVVVVVLVGLGMSLWLARALGATRSLGFLAAASTGICGVTAALAVAPVVEADRREVAYTVANVTLFGLFGMLVYPYLAHALLGGAPESAGLFLGTAIHDTSQVMGAALSYQEVFANPEVAEVATVTKLTRNAMLVAVVPALALLHRRGSGAAVRVKGLFPLFVLGFLAASALRSLGDAMLAQQLPALGVFDAASWRAAISLVGGDAAGLALATALAALGLSTKLSIFRELGWRPFWIGLGAAASVSATGLALAWALAA